jgi:ATP-dependent DNA helicase RecQ
LETLLKVLDVAGVVERVEGGWRATGRAWVYDRDRHDGVAAARRAEQQVMRDYLGGTQCLMELLRRELDDPLAKPCGRCSVCTGQLPAPGATPRPETVSAAVAHLRSQITVLEPRKMWPSGSPRRGKIAPAFRCEPGRALAVGDDDAAWSEALTEFFTGGAVSDELMSGVVAALAKWGWPAGRPTWVTWVPSRRSSSQIIELAGRIAEVGKLPLVPALAAEGPGFQADAPTNGSAATTALRRLSVLADSVLAGPVLVIDDYTRSGFTLTASAALLREAGSGPVYPFAVTKRY